MSSAYTTEDALKATLTMTGTTFADYDIAPAIAAASDSLNEICGRKFDLDTSSDTVRYYRPSSPTRIIVNDMIAITSLEGDLDGNGAFEKTWVKDVDYFMWPYNNLQEDRPYTQIELNAYRATTGFPHYVAHSIKVTGKFGWPIVPSFLEVSAKMLAAKLIKRMREAPFGIVTVGLDVGSAMRIAREDPDLMNLCREFTREKVV